nr:TVP38/TMEM64 family protein [uncultured bacterium]
MVLLAVSLVAALVVAAFLLPVPEPTQLRTWALGAGAAAPALMFLTYVVATLVPIPRTVFSVASGLLLGPVVGVTVALIATVVSGLLSYALARSLGRRMVARHLERASVRAVDERLTGGGWLAVASLRLIPVVPFLPTNYACGLSSVRTRPYLVGTMVGSLPGTTAAVALGDTLTGSTPPVLLVVYGLCAIVGATGLWFAIRRNTPERLRVGGRPSER